MENAVKAVRECWRSMRVENRGQRSRKDALRPVTRKEKEEERERGWREREGESVWVSICARLYLGDVPGRVTGNAIATIYYYPPIISLAIHSK